MTLTQQTVVGSRVSVEERGPGTVVAFHRDREWRFHREHVTFLIVDLDAGERITAHPSACSNLEAARS